MYVCKLKERSVSHLLGLSPDVACLIIITIRPRRVEYIVLGGLSVLPFVMAYVCLLVLVACLGSLAHAQPQCMDLLPPYDYSDAFYCPEVSYCTEYSEYGCCERREDRYAQRRATFALQYHLNDQERELCSDFVRNVSCLSCSPYAGRIFDSANGGREFPRLCRGYCIEAYSKCRVSLLRMFKLHPWKEGLVSKDPRDEEELARDAQAFCEHYAPEDSPYCYPQVLERPKPSGELGCVCALPVASGLRVPVAAVHAGDGSGRLFIAELTGVVRILDAKGKFLEEPFLDMSSQIMAGFGRGLLNLAFHPRYKENGLLYVYYNHIVNANGSASGGAIISSNISEFRVRDDDPNKVNYTTQRLIFSFSYAELDPTLPDLFGGALFFEDGFLYLGMGDEEEVENVQSRAQDL